MVLRDTAKDIVDKHNILYVDDEEINLRVFKSTFKKHYNVFTCTSGSEALELLQEKDIELIVTDQRMPEMNGTELLGKVVPNHPNICRMIMTGFSDLEVIIQAVNNYGIHQYITKPWDYQSLKSTFDNFLTKDTKLELKEEPAPAAPKEDQSDLKKFTEALISNKADNIELVGKHFENSYLLNYSDSCEGKENVFIYEFKKEDALLGLTIGCEITGIRGTMIKANVEEFAKDILLSKKAFNPVDFYKDLIDATSAYLKILNMAGDEVQIQMMYKHVSKPNVWILTNSDAPLFYKDGNQVELKFHSRLSTYNLTIYRLASEICDRFYIYSADHESNSGPFVNELKDKISAVQNNDKELRKIELQSFVDFSITNNGIDKFALLEIGV